MPIMKRLQIDKPIWQVLEHLSGPADLDPAQKTTALALNKRGEPKKEPEPWQVECTHSFDVTQRPTDVQKIIDRAKDFCGDIGGNPWIKKEGSFVYHQWGLLDLKVVQTTQQSMERLKSIVDSGRWTLKRYYGVDAKQCREAFAHAMAACGPDANGGVVIYTDGHSYEWGIRDNPGYFPPNPVNGPDAPEVVYVVPTKESEAPGDRGSVAN
ncbi:hypothetical protein MPH_09458 [Macrophomina phaseolina MS6]|uniref:Uncharacterized protein n=1 Tax=Macrophomina phaseolina (strain MS6) TaxID=1126212 RepID=K2RKQ6_MACPH|nr:hypothetical protein MPH_09458 [Macrophomina phaseolina MS6]